MNNVYVIEAWLGLLLFLTVLLAVLLATRPARRSHTSYSLFHEWTLWNYTTESLKNRIEAQQELIKVLKRQQNIYLDMFALLQKQGYLVQDTGPDRITPEAFARLFYSTYERLAPECGYVPVSNWDSLSESGRQLLVATSTEILKELYGTKKEII